MENTFPTPKNTIISLEKLPWEAEEDGGIAAKASVAPGELSLFRKPLVIKEKQSQEGMIFSKPFL